MNEEKKLLETPLALRRAEEKKYCEKAAEMMSQLAEKGIRNTSEKRAERLRHCSDSVLCKATKDFEKMKYAGDVRCRDRFCPHCQRVESVKTAIELQTILSVLRAEGYVPLMLTLTVPNCDGTGFALYGTLAKMSQSFHRLLNKLTRDDLIPMKGFYKTVEVTYNKRAKTFHPHYHIVLVFEKGFNKELTKKLQRVILNHWRESYPSLKRIDQVKLDSVGETIKDVFEVSKYCAKSSDYLDNGLDVFEAFVTGLRGCRLRAFGGIMNEKHKLYKANKLEIPEDLQSPKKEEEDWYWFVWLKWNHETQTDTIKNCMRISDIEEADFIAKKEGMSPEERRVFEQASKEFKHRNYMENHVLAGENSAIESERSERIEAKKGEQKKGKSDQLSLFSFSSESANSAPKSWNAKA